MALFKEFTMENFTRQTKETENVSGTDIRFVSFVGVDLHKCTVSLKAVNTDGKLVASLTSDTKCVNKIEDWINALPSVSLPQKATSCSASL